ncbi:hypothetical protein COU54_04770 [Candidatus Pacearchaeota archaeon CG10_big_fil_rev_8_21_14_0_10_31_24]|nr:MAG: hypothetical protein COU54_04770 [Candidatus Pacearchaeota archaeon CG10_big_fil_rev_8_21_14_0_10_31_24]
MVSLTISIPEDLKSKMEQFPEVNWSALVRKTVIERTKELEWRQEMLKKLKEEQEFTNWTIQEGRKVNTNISKKLKKEGLL